MATTVTNVILNEVGDPIVNAYVKISLLAPTENSIAWLSDLSAQIMSNVVVRTDDDGSWSLALTPNSLITPANSFYRVTEHITGSELQHSYIVVPNDDNAHAMVSLLTTPPEDLPISASLIAFGPEAGMISTNVEDAIFEAFNNGGGGGGGTGSLLHALPFSFDTANILTGATVYAPAIGDILLDAWIEIDTPWDGTTPKGDVGSFVGSAGWFTLTGGTVLDMTQADVFLGDGDQPLGSPNISDLHVSSLYNNPFRRLPGRFTTTSPIKIVVSQDGSNAGADPGSTQGSGTLYLLVARPAGDNGDGGGSFPTYYQWDSPVDPADGDTWIRFARNDANDDDTYPNSFAVGLFRWSLNSDQWLPIGTVALDSEGHVLGIVSVGTDGNIVIERWTGGVDNAALSYFFMGDTQISMATAANTGFPHTITSDATYGTCLDGVVVEGMVEVKLFRGDWVSDNYYNISEMVRGSDNHTYVAKLLSHNSDPTTDNGNLWYQVTNDFPALVIHNLPVAWSGIEVDPGTFGLEAPAGSIFLNNREQDSFGSFHVKAGLGSTDWTSQAITDAGTFHVYAYNPNQSVNYAEVEVAPSSVNQPAGMITHAPTIGESFYPLALVNAGEWVQVVVEPLMHPVASWDTIDYSGTLTVWNQTGTELIEVTFGTEIAWDAESSSVAIFQQQLIGSDLSVVNDEGGYRIVSAAGGTYNVLIKANVGWD